MSLKPGLRFAKATIIYFLTLPCFGETALNENWACMHAPRDCSDHRGRSGIYMTTTGHGNIPTFCEMPRDGKEQFIVILRREHNSSHLPLDFNNTWEDYKWGFGSLSGEFWWGLEHIWRLTSSLDREYQLHILLLDFNGNYKAGTYQNFKLKSEKDGYRLTIGKFNGTLNDALAFHAGMKFSTPDRDNDMSRKRNCANEYHTGWWFNSCMRGLLTGIPENAINSGKDACWKEKKMCWRDASGRYVPYKEAFMLISRTFKA